MYSENPFRPITEGVEITFPAQRRGHTKSLAISPKNAKNIRGHSCAKTVLKSRGLGVSFQAQTICPEVVERPFDRLTILPSAMSSLRSELRSARAHGRGQGRRRAEWSHIEGHLIFAYMAGSPTEQVFLSDGPCMCPETLSSRRWGGGKGRVEDGPNGERILPLRERDVARPVKSGFVHPKGFNGASELQ